MSHVYILRHIQQPRFKIGKANDIISRARNFRWDTIDFSNSFGISVPSEMDAYTLEKILHRTFRHARVSADEVIAGGGNADGASEWFAISCWPRLLRYLEDNHDLHPHEIIDGESLGLVVKKLTQPSEAALAREQWKSEKEARRVERQEAHLALHRAQMAELGQSLRLIRPKLVEELEHHRQERNVVGICHGRFGSHLVLACASPSPTKEMLWRLPFQDTQYSTRYGGGSVIDGYKQITHSKGRICAVSIPRLKHDKDSTYEPDNIIHQVFKDELTWLGQLQEIPETWLEAIFPIGFTKLRGEMEEASDRAVERLMQFRQEVALSELRPLR